MNTDEGNWVLGSAEKRRTKPIRFNFQLAATSSGRWAIDTTDAIKNNKLNHVARGYHQSLFSSGSFSD